MAPGHQTTTNDRLWRGSVRTRQGFDGQNKRDPANTSAVSKPSIYSTAVSYRIAEHFASRISWQRAAGSGQQETVLIMDTGHHFRPHTDRRPLPAFPA